MSKATEHIKSIEKKKNQPKIDSHINNDLFFRWIIVLFLSFVITAFGLLTYKNPVYLALMMFGLTMLIILKLSQGRENYSFWFLIFTIIYVVLDFYLYKITHDTLSWKKLIPFSSYSKMTMRYFFSYLGIIPKGTEEISNLLGFSYMCHNLTTFLEISIFLSIFRFCSKLIKEI